MEISIRRNCLYFEVVIEDGNMTFDTGLLSKEEAVEMAKEFISAAEDLLPSFDCIKELAEIREVL